MHRKSLPLSLLVRKLLAIIILLSNGLRSGIVALLRKTHTRTHSRPSHIPERALACTLPRVHERTLANTNTRMQTHATASTRTQLLVNLRNARKTHAHMRICAYISEITSKHAHACNSTHAHASALL